MLSVSCTRASFRGRRLALPSILQWNTNGLRTFLSELRRELLHAPIDVLALQEENALPSESLIRNYATYNSMPVHPNGTPKASLVVNVEC